MRRLAFIVGLQALLLLAAETAVAKSIVRATELLEQVQIQGISLAMSPGEAFNTLRAAGFNAGELSDFGDWDSDSIEFERGEYGSPAGHSSVVLSRRGDRILMISETYNAPGNPIDAIAEIDAVRAQLNIPASDPLCRTAGDHTGVCEVRDAELGSEANILFTLQIGTIMRLVSISRHKELGAP